MSFRELAREARVLIGIVGVLVLLAAGAGLFIRLTDRDEPLIPLDDPTKLQPGAALLATLWLDELPRRQSVGLFAPGEGESDADRLRRALEWLPAADPVSQSPFLQTVMMGSCYEALLCRTADGFLLRVADTTSQGDETRLAVRRFASSRGVSSPRKDPVSLGRWWEIHLGGDAEAAAEECLSFFRDCLNRRPTDEFWILTSDEIYSG